MLASRAAVLGAQAAAARVTVTGCHGHGCRDGEGYGLPARWAGPCGLRQGVNPWPVATGAAADAAVEPRRGAAPRPRRGRIYKLNGRRPCVRVQEVLASRRVRKPSEAARGSDLQQAAISHKKKKNAPTSERGKRVVERVGERAPWP